MRISSLRLVVTALLLVPLSGCAAAKAVLSSAFERPSLAFQRIEASGWSADGVDLNVVFRATNPNNLALEIAQVDYALAIEGHRVVSGSPNRGVSLPANGSKDLVFPARVRFLDVVPVVTALFARDTLKWQASGSLGIDTPIGILAYPLSHSGQLQIPKKLK